MNPLITDRQHPITHYMFIYVNTCLLIFIVCVCVGCWPARNVTDTAIDVTDTAIDVSSGDEDDDTAAVSHIVEQVLSLTINKVYFI